MTLPMQQRPLPMGAVKYQEPEDDPVLAWRKKLEQRNTQMDQVNQENRVSPLQQAPDVNVYDARRQGTIQQGQNALVAAKNVAQQQEIRTQAIRQRKAQDQSRYAAAQARQKAAYEIKKQQWSAWKQQSQQQQQYQEYMQQIQNGQYGYTTQFMGAQSGAGGAGSLGQVGQAQNGQYSYSNSTYNQIAQWARQAGWSESDIPMVVSIAMAESGGNPAARHSNNDSHGSVDMGLMQINNYWQRDKLGNGVNIDDPITNLRIAKQAYDEGGWGLWSTYNNGAYRNFLSDATSNRSQVQGLQPVQSAPYSLTSPDGRIRQAVVQNAQHVIGLPYVWGGASLSSGADCSGLVDALYKQLGIDIPQAYGSGGGRAQAQVTGLTSRTSGVHGVRTSVNNLQPGDLVAWQGGWAGDQYIGHIAVYIGNGQIIESPDVGMTVRQRSLRPNENTFGVHLSFS